MNSSISAVLIMNQKGWDNCKYIQSLTFSTCTLKDSELVNDTTDLWSISKPAHCYTNYKRCARVKRDAPQCAYLFGTVTGTVPFPTISTWRDKWLGLPIECLFTMYRLVLCETAIV